MGSRSTRALGISLLLLVAVVVGPGRAVAQDEDAPATALRVTLDRLLGEHALLSMEVVRGAIEGIYGPDAGAAFAEQWRNHIAYLYDYARARAEGDSDATELARDQLDR